MLSQALLPVILLITIGDRNLCFTDVETEVLSAAVTSPTSLTSGRSRSCDSMAWILTIMLVPELMCRDWSS